MRTSSSIHSLCRSINFSLFSYKTQFLNIPCHGFNFQSSKLRNVWCNSLSDSHKPHTQITTLSVCLEKIVDESNTGNTDVQRARQLKQKSEALGIVYDDHFVPGKFYNLLCPKCKGGHTLERSLSFYIVLTGDIGMWRCFRIDCGWSGRVYGDNPVKRVLRPPETLTEEYLRLMPPGDEVISYFRKRMISEETLHRNRVMQFSKEMPAIAFTYRREGVLVTCKYRALEKRFWREKDTEKIFYGLDDIVDADEIIIVEGEFDKLSFEEAGFRNCVSVPDGAPMRGSEILPPPEMDVQFEYLWNCKKYLDKASRIILATDDDKPGRLLAKELVRRIGNDRCWQVRWPKKDEFTRFKDANDVLTHLGPSALKDIIESAELYSEATEVDEQAQLKIESLFSAMNFFPPKSE